MRPSLLIAVAPLAAAAVLSAQGRDRSKEQGPWRPWHFTAIASVRQSLAAGPADVQAWETRLRELSAIVKRTPAVSPPIGFAAEASGILNGYGPARPGVPEGKTLPLSGYLSFGAFPLVEYLRNGRLVNEDLKGGETTLLHFYVNQIEGQTMAGGPFPADWSGEEVAGFIAPKPRPPLAGLPRFGDMLVLKSNPNPLWIPFALGDALAPAIAQRRKLFENVRDNFARETAEFAAWLTPANRAARRAEWNKSAALLGENGKGLVANMEKAEVEIEASNRARLAPGGPAQRGVQDAERRLREAEGVLAGYSAEVQAAPSCHDASASNLAGRFRPLAGAPPGCEALVKTNWAYFNPKLPRAAPQVLTIRTWTFCADEPAQQARKPTGCDINRSIVTTLDWNAVRAWLDR